MMGFPVEPKGAGPLHRARDNVDAWPKILCRHPKLLETWHRVEKVGLLSMDCVCEMMEFRVELKGSASAFPIQDSRLYECNIPSRKNTCPLVASP